MSDKLPLLTNVDAVEVVDLEGVRPAPPHDYMAAASKARHVRLDGTDAAAIVTVWNRLPAGRQARCHVPPFGFRFLEEGDVVVEASVCWRCNNVAGKEGDDEFWYEFDAEAPEAVELLERAKKALVTT
jgi:hypothetical protein